MKKLFTKNIIYTLIIVVMLVISMVLRPQIISKGKDVLPDNLKGKNIVTVWMKQAKDSDTRIYQVNRYNKENKDNIYIDFKVYKEDYYNLIRTFLASKTKPDIFEYGYYELVKNEGKLLNLKELNIDRDYVGKENFLYFNGEPIGTKVSGRTVKLALNKEIFQQCGLDPNKPPQTWKELQDYSRIIKEKMPNVIPFEFPSSTWGEMKYSIGEASAYNNNLYTTFWNYKEGKYDFKYAKDILNVYKNMYENNLIPKELDKNGSIDLRRDFFNEKAAMIVSNFEDKDYFENIIPLRFEMAISDLPKFNSEDKGNFYYTENYSAIVVNKQIKNKEAVSKVYNWLLGNDINKELAQTGKTLTTLYKESNLKGRQYNEYNDVKQFKQEVYDPTIYINYKPEDTRNLFLDAIKGKKTIDESINQLNKNYEGYCKFMIEKDKFNFDLYIDKNK